MNPTYDRIHLGVSQLVWGYDLSRADRLVQCLDEASDIGYEGVLLFDSTLPFWYNRPTELKRMLDERMLTVAGVIHRPSLDFKSTAQLARFVVAIGGDRLVISGPDGTQAEWNISLPLLERHGEIANANGLRANYHHHTGWIAETMEQYERFLSDTDRRKIGAILTAATPRSTSKGILHSNSITNTTMSSNTSNSRITHCKPALEPKLARVPAISAVSPGQ